ncbi:hypothetical protein JVU11DRAFT_1226 [Chiua virens]|nr:hypothetical protein JVU11DRAFT_1226 [Chiua virens]
MQTLELEIHVVYPHFLVPFCADTESLWDHAVAINRTQTMEEHNWSVWAFQNDKTCHVFLLLNVNAVSLNLTAVMVVILFVSNLSSE